jgi:hypothetical protein
VHHADDVIELLAIYRQSRVALGADLQQRLFQRHVYPHRHDVGARQHYVVRGGLAKAQHIGDQRALLPVELRLLARDHLLVRRLLHQFGDRFTQAVLRLAAEHLA